MSCSRTAFLLIRRSHGGVGSIPVMGLRGISPPPFQCAVLSLEGAPVRVVIYNVPLTGSSVLILAYGCMEWNDRV